MKMYDETIFSATQLLQTPHGTQFPLTISVLRNPDVVNAVAWTSQINAIPPYTKHFLAFSCKRSHSYNMLHVVKISFGKLQGESFCFSLSFCLLTFTIFLQQLPFSPTQNFPFFKVLPSFVPRLIPASPRHYCALYKFIYLLIYLLTCQCCGCLQPHMTYQAYSVP